MAEEKTAQKPGPAQEMFVRTDLLDSLAVFRRLKDANDPLAEHLTKRFRPETRKLLEDHDASGPPGVALEEALTQEFNRIAAGPLVFDAKAFSRVEVNADTRKLLDGAPKGKELVRLNAMLIEDAFPTELLRNHTRWPKVPAERVQTGVRIEKRMLKVLKGMAEYDDMTLGEMLEDVVLHAFDGGSRFDGEEARERIAALKKVYDMDYDAHAAYRFVEARS